MADIVRKHAVSVEGPNVRERLQAMDDSAVVTAFLGGEERAFSELVTRYQTRLLNFVYRTIGDREKAEDLVQEVFIRVYRHLHRFDRSKKFSTWVYTIASNLAKNELRNRSRNPLVLFQTVQKNFQDEDRPLQFEDTTSRPDDMYRKNLSPWIVASFVISTLPSLTIRWLVLSWSACNDISLNVRTVPGRMQRSAGRFCSSEISPP